MKKKMLAMYPILFLLIVLSITFIYEQEKETTIQGVVTELDWDDEGNVISLAIDVTVESVEDEDGEMIEESEYYTVVLDDKGKELLKLVDETVEVTGIVKVDKEDNKTIKVKKYKVIES